MTKYEEIYQDIVKKIDSDTYIAGSQLPSERNLMEEYNASRDTIRKSLNLLIQNGYIQKSRGRKSIILDKNRFQLPFSDISSFKEVTPLLGKDVRTKVVSLVKRKPDKNMQKILQIDENEPIWILKRVRYIDGEAVIYDIDYLVEKYTPGLTKAIAEDSIYKYFEGTLNLVIAYADKIFTCQAPNDEDEKYLDLKDFQVLVNIDSYVHLEDSTIFQYTSSHHRPDKFRFENTARRKKNV